MLFLTQITNSSIKYMNIKFKFIICSLYFVLPISPLTTSISCKLRIGQPRDEAQIPGNKVLPDLKH